MQLWTTIVCAHVEKCVFARRTAYVVAGEGVTCNEAVALMV